MKRVVDARSGLRPTLQANARLVLRATLLFAVATAPAAANTFNVDTGTDGGQQPGNTTTCVEVNASNTPTGHCSLRAAIGVGNGITGPHTININALVVTIQNGGMTDMRAKYTLNGNLHMINGNGQGCLSLTDSGTEQAAPPIHNAAGATGSTIQGLVIGHCNSDAIAANGHGYTFQNNFIGVDATGSPGVFAGANKTTGAGISLSASAAYGSQFIDVAGLKSLYDALPVQPVDSIEINNFSVNIATALQNLNPNTISGNVISNNAKNGIDIFSQNLAATIIKTNFIGTNSTGTVAVPNGMNGIALEGSTFANLIGPGNIIAGNTQNGISVAAGAVFLPNFIMGNYIGVNGTLASHVGNGQSGIVVDSFPDTSAGHFNPSMTGLIIGPLNVISDNQGTNNILNLDDQNDTQAGIVITGASTGIKVLGNRIGLNDSAPGVPSSSTLFGNLGDGIIITTKGNKIGGSGATDGNVISGNLRHGILVKTGAISNSILGNSIGTDPAFAGNLGLGNGVDGIHIDNGNSTTIGGSGSTDFNTIAGNGRNGIKIRNGDITTGWSNLSQRNLVYHNATALVSIPGHAGVGIDLDYAEDAANSIHGEFLGGSYANFDQAQPVICAGPADTGACSGSAAPNSSGGTTTLQWTINTHGPANFRMEFFQIDTADDNTATTMTFLGEQLFSTDLSGTPSNSAECSAAVCTASIVGSTGGSHIIMTATDVTPLTNTAGNLGDWKANLVCFAGDIGVPLLSACNVNNTSEFSNVATIPTAPPSVVTDPASAITTTTATLNGTISANGADATVSFDYGLTSAYGNNDVAATPATVTASQDNVAVSLNISTLTCNTTYHYRVKASNSNGPALGSDLTFTTAPCAAAAPTATTVAASAIAGTSATINGIVSANGATTTVKFQYGTTVAYAGAGSPLNAAQNPLSSGSTNAPVSVALSGLTCNTTYHFRVTANNGVGGTINGSDLTFQTAICSPTAPTVATAAATAIAATSATLNGTASSNGAITTVTFDFGTTAAYGALGSPATAAQSPLSTGASGAAVSLNLTGLTCNTLYHFRANANNGVGSTVNGGDLTFTTGACVQAPPAVTTLAATAVTAVTATLNGKVSANGAATTVTFEYGATAAYGGAGSPATAAQSPLAAGSPNNTAVSFDLAGLACGSTYHFRADASNSGGSPTGTDLTFTTAPCAATPPTATTNAASSIATTSALLNGTVSANGASTTVNFDFGLTVAYGSSVAATQSPLSSGASAAPVSTPLSGLTCGTLYHFRVNATNSAGGPVNGIDQTFTTAACLGVAPTATTGAASTVSATGATLNGTVSANGAATTVSFDYGSTAAYGSSAAAAESPLAAGSPANAPVTAALATLTCNQLYHFRANANNGTGGTIHGADATFTTGACPALPPTAATGAASAIVATGATLNGTVSANGAATTVMFEYGTTAAYGSMLAATQSPLAAAASNSAVSVAATGLACATLYHFRVDANNGVGGTISGIDQTFTTGACSAPTAITGAATAITIASATLNGTVSANGAATTVTFEYGTSTAYGASAPAAESPLGAASAANAPVTAAISGLSCGTQYHFRVDADNGSSSNGSDATFTTSACPAGAPTPVTGAATAITVSGATLNGTVSANGAATTVTFEYGTTAAYGSTVAATQSPLASGSPNNAAVSVPASGLACGTLYHFRVDANNGNGGTIPGADATFSTSVCPAGAPTPITGAASAIGAVGATLNGTVSANGAATTVTFEYGTTVAYGSTAAATQSPLASGSPNNAPVSVPVSGLVCGTLYHFRVDANNGNGGTIPGADATFTTSICAVVTTYSGPTATGTGTATAILSGGGPTCTLTNPAFVAAPVPAPAGVTFPDGLFQFSATGCSGTITVTVTFPTAFSAGEQYYKYGPTPGPIAAHWYTLGAGNSLTLVGNVATFTIADGGLGDDDLAVNGTIVDQGGPGVPPPAGNAAAVPAPTLTAWAMLALIGLFGAAGLSHGRKRHGVDARR